MRLIDADALLWEIENKRRSGHCSYQDIVNCILNAVPPYKSKYDERKAQGLCVACGKQPPMAGRTRCKPCLIKNADNAFKRRHKND